jgi:hypothetical protein
MHLARETNASDLVSSNASEREYAADGLLPRSPPVFRTLLGPQRALHPDVFVRGGEAVLHAAGFVD